MTPGVRLRNYHIWYFFYLNSFGKRYRFNDIANYDILSCNAMIHNEIQCNTMQHRVIQWNVMQFNKMQYNIKQNHSITCNNNTILRHLRSANPIYRMVSSISYLIFTTTKSWRPTPDQHKNWQPQLKDSDMCQVIIVFIKRSTASKFLGQKKKSFRKNVVTWSMLVRSMIRSMVRSMIFAGQGAIF